MPQFLPDGHRFLFIAGSDKPGYSLSGLLRWIRRNEPK